MKKPVKILCTVLAVCVIAAAVGSVCYVAGYKNGRATQASAMPKSVIAVPEETVIPEGETETISEEIMVNIPPEEQTREIKKQEQSSADASWTAVDRSSSQDEGGTVTLYTSAQKEDGEIIWDDSQKWMVEVTDGDGGYYTLYDSYVSNGSVYYDVVQKESGDKIINVYTMSGTEITIKQYSYSGGVFVEKEIYNSGTVNRIHTTVPNYSE